MSHAPEKIVEIRPHPEGGVIVKREGMSAEYAPYTHTVGEPPIQVIVGYRPAVWEDHVTDPAIITQIRETARRQ